MYIINHDLDKTMTMHIMHPGFNHLGKSKGKRKFRNSTQAKNARELAASWDQKQAEWKKMSKPAPMNVTTKAPSLMPKIPAGRDTNHIPSLDTKVTGAVNVKQTPHYTGDNVLGVTIVHKSCLQPIFNKEAAVDAANMRR